ncbi:hypothetical protein CNECB9_3880015 [Cupriavidus necator]|uniref:Uncharacterized protein n=1 Tax=Cupriavidus necator TaxID=106590 RepID=A0A1K0IK04_CUPNE|nr:hypothetical protein CNECB9_3880015 [Cupriavidus necator]
MIDRKHIGRVIADFSTSAPANQLRFFAKATGQWYAILDCHMTAPFRILRAAYPHIRALAAADKEAGREVYRKVVNISSVSGLNGNASQIN